MSPWLLLRLPESILSIIAVAYAISLYVMPRRFGSRSAWTGAVLLVLLCTMLAAAILYNVSGAVVPIGISARGYLSLYAILLLPLTAAALALRSRIRSRALGALMLLAAACGLYAIGAHVSGLFLTFVNASG